MFVRLSCKDDLDWDPRFQDWSACDSQGTEVNSQDPSKGGLDDQPLQYRVCAFDDCMALWPNVCSLQCHSRLIAAASLCGLPLPVPMPGSLRAVNINTLIPGQGYQKHVDSNAVTAIIFLTSCEGGALEIFDKSGLVSIDHRAGQGVVFAGGTVPHLVQKIKAGVSRMLLFSYGDISSITDPELELQLYGRTSKIANSQFIQELN